MVMGSVLLKPVGELVEVVGQQGHGGGEVVAVAIVVYQEIGALVTGGDIVPEEVVVELGRVGGFGIPEPKTESTVPYAAVLPVMLLLVRVAVVAVDRWRRRRRHSAVLPAMLLLVRVTVVAEIEAPPPPLHGTYYFQGDCG